MRPVLKKILSLLIVVILLALAFHYWQGHDASKSVAKKSKAAKSMVSVTMLPIKSQEAPLIVSVYGSVISPASSKISALNSAIVKAILFKAGQKVTKGQLLFNLAPTGEASQLAALKSTMQQTKDSYQRYLAANKEYAGTIAKDTVEIALDKYQQAKQTYMAAMAASQIVAPAAGVISTSSVAVGDAVAPATLLATLADPDNLQLEYTLPSQYLSLAKVGQLVTFLADGQKTAVKGSVVYVSPQLDANSSLTIRATLNKTATLAANQFGQVKQTVNPKQQMLMVSQSLVQTDSRGFYVYGVELGKVTKYYFKPGSLTAKGLLEIKSGLKAGTLIISTQSGAINVGQKVQIKGQKSPVDK